MFTGGAARKKSKSAKLGGQRKRSVRSAAVGGQRKKKPGSKKASKAGKSSRK